MRLSGIDLTKNLDKATYQSIISDSEIKLGELQRKARTLGLPVIIVFEGWDAAGKGTLINRLLMALDARGFTVHSINPPKEDELRRPFLWRFWIKTPEKGRFAIFDRSWYGKVLVERVNKIVKRNVWLKAYEEINAFEKHLVNDGTVIIKFFLHISKKEQKKRFQSLLVNPATAWKVTEDDWVHHKQYDEYFMAVEGMLDKTDTELAPWTCVEAHDRRFATIKVFNTVIDAIERKIAEMEHASGLKKSETKPTVQFEDAQKTILDKMDLSLTMTREIYEEELKIYQARIRELEHEVYIKKIPIIIVFQGWDAAGKGGAIRRLVQGMDPRGYEVVTTAAPNDLEKSHHYLWRFWTKIPKTGHITIFDRSWYGRVLVERIEGFCTEQEWRRAYSEIKEMEEQFVNFGTILMKFWMHVDQDEQLRRFNAREVIPYKKWKINDEDWRNRGKWDQYKIAVDEMLFRTSTSYAPWTIVEANCKLYARIKVLKTVVQEIEKRL